MDFSQFFTPQEQFAPGSGFALYGAFHLGWLAAIGAAVLLCCLWYRRQDAPRQQRFLRGLALLLIAEDTLKMVIIAVIGGPLRYNLPLHLCGLSMFVYLMVAFRPSDFWRELVYCLCMPGAVAALLFCDWTECPPLHFSGIHSFLHHGYLVTFAMVLLTSGQLRPNWRMLPRCFGALCLTAVPLYLLNRAIDANYLFLNVPSPGSPLELLARLLGNPGYIAGAAGLVVAVWAVLYTPWVLAQRRQLSRRAAAPAGR